MSELFHYGILGMHWGVRRYQNKDGTLTEAGKKRLERDTLRNAQKKPKDRADEADLIDPRRWVDEDTKNAQSITNDLKSIANSAQDIERATRQTSMPKIDLSKMTDTELRSEINRMLLEKQYNSLKNPVEVSRGREKVNQVLDVSGKVLAIGSSALGIALAINQLKGG